MRKRDAQNFGQEVWRELAWWYDAHGADKMAAMRSVVRPKIKRATNLDDAARAMQEFDATVQHYEAKFGVRSDDAKMLGVEQIVPMGLLEKLRREKHNTYFDQRHAIVSYINDMYFETTERETPNLQQGPTPMDICYAGYHRERETGGSGSSSEIRYGGFPGYHRERDGGGSGSSSYNSIPSGCQPDSWMDLEYLSAFLHTVKGKGKGKAKGKKGDSKSSSAKSQKGSNTPSTKGKGEHVRVVRARLGLVKGMDNTSLDVSSKFKTMTTPTSPCSRVMDLSEEEDIPWTPVVREGTLKNVSFVEDRNTRIYHLTMGDSEILSATTAKVGRGSRRRSTVSHTPIPDYKPKSHTCVMLEFRY
jgi:hypothetical protein